MQDTKKYKRGTSDATVDAYQFVEGNHVTVQGGQSYNVEPGDYCLSYDDFKTASVQKQAEFEDRFKLVVEKKPEPEKPVKKAEKKVTKKPVKK